MSIERVRRLLRQRENILLEFKEAKAELPETLFETICAMLNRDGGDILLGVADNGVVKGVDPSKVETLKANLVNLSNANGYITPNVQSIHSCGLRIWLTLNDEQILQKAGLRRNDTQAGQEGYTLAAALLLGKDEVIKSILPHYKIDALVRRVNTDRYDDRDYIDTNLIDAYDRLMDFTVK